MTNYQLKDKGRIERVMLSKWQTFWYYTPVLIWLPLPFLFIKNIFNYYVTHTYSGNMSIKALIIGAFIYVMIDLIFFLHLTRRRKFLTININVDQATFAEAVERTAEKLKWTIEEKTSEKTVAKKGMSKRSWGEHITILWYPDKILFNSICDPDSLMAVTTRGMNKKNRLVFEQILNEIVIDRQHEVASVVTA